jgi:ligand-binding sensor domain-containing protein/signal transduction histidine kinase
LDLLKGQWLIASLLLICARTVSASPPKDLANYSMQSWQVEDGLPYDSVNRIVQGRQGFIWVASIGGLVRFDGAHFQTFTSPLIVGAGGRNIRDLVAGQGDSLLMLPATGGIVQLTNGVFSLHPASARLAGRQLVSLFEEPDGTLWVGTLDGHVIRWKDGRMIQFGSKDGLSDHVWTKPDFAMDSKGQVWIADGDFLGVYQDGRLARINEGLASPIAVAPSRSGGIWVAGRDRLLKMENGQFITVSTNFPWAASAAVKDIYEDRAGGLWLGTSARGLFRMTGGTFHRMATSDRSITSITEDREGDLWVSTAGGGIDRLNSSIATIYNIKSGLNEDVSDAVCEDRQGTMWFANRSGGVARLTGGLVSMVRFPGGRNLSAQAILADDQDRIWVGAESGLYRFPADHPERLKMMNPSLQRVHVLFLSHNGDVWVAAEPASLGRFHNNQYQAFSEADGFLGERIRAITQDKAGTIWIGTENGELYSWTDNRFTRFTQNDGLPGAPIRALHADADGLWIGTIGGGLVLYAQGHFHTVSFADGLPDNVISQIQEDDHGRLWCGTRRGIFNVKKRDLLDYFAGKIPEVNVVTFGKSDELSKTYCLASQCQPNTWKGGDGQLWFATQEGVVDLDADAFKPNLLPPPVLVEGLKVNDQWLATTGMVRVAPCPRKLEFQFAALSYVAPGKVRFKYKLDGVDSVWNETAEGDVVYAGLPPGRYQLHVTACNNDGVWDKRDATLPFVVLRAWWQTWWFRGGMLLMFAGVVAAGGRHWANRRWQLRLGRLEQQQAVERDRARIARDIHDDLGAGLTQITLLCELARREPAEAEAHLEHISDSARQLTRDMDEIVWAVDPQHDTFSGLMDYLSAFAEDYLRVAGIRCRMDLPPTYPEARVDAEMRHNLFLALKEMLNNVVKHARASEVWLRLRMGERAFTLIVEDNGQGVQAANGDTTVMGGERICSGAGLPNLRKRLGTIGGQCVVHSSPSHGTRVEMTLGLNGAVSPIVAIEPSRLQP